ncbi:hypothetical protein BGZ76_002879 [Entomortierella beljakovae]|nr:hypothetical protein BGZ76_002879 [Entomortierella beljakovae]
MSAGPTPQDFSNDDPGQSQSLQGSNNNLLGGSHDSLGSSILQSGSNASRRASFNLSTGSLNFNPSTSSSMASPSSPSYSTIAVARARAAAAAAAAGEGGQGAIVDGDNLGHTGSGVFPGALEQNPFSSLSSPSTSSVPSSSKSQDLYFNSKQPRAPLSKSLTSSASSLLSNASASSSGSGSGSGSSSAIQSHLQENANAEREISMILDDFLYLGGDLVDEEQVLELERLGIKRVLNVAANCDDELWIQRAGKDNGSYLKVGLLDHVDQDLKASLDVATKFIESSTTPVYVHCQAGKSRSVATVIGYLIQGKKWPLKKAYDHVVERRRIMSPNIGFVSQLIMLEERVLGDNAGGLVSTVGTDEEVNPASRTTVLPWMIS